MKIYSSKDCSKCQLACNILNNFGLSYDYIDNPSEVQEASKTSGFLELPILELDGQFYSGQKAIQKIAALNPKI